MILTAHAQSNSNISYSKKYIARMRVRYIAHARWAHSACVINVYYSRKPQGS